MSITREEGDALARRQGYSTLQALVNDEKRKIIRDAHAREDYDRRQWEAEEKAKRLREELGRIKKDHASTGIVGGSWKDARWALVLGDRSRRDIGLVKVEGAASRIGENVAFWRSEADKMIWVAKKQANDTFLAGQRLRKIPDSASLSHLPNSPLELRNGADGCVNFDAENLQGWYNIIDRERTRLEEVLGALALSSIKPQLVPIWSGYVGLQVVLEINFRRRS